MQEHSKVKRTARDFLVNLIDRAKAHDLITVAASIDVISCEESALQSQIDVWKSLVYEFENRPTKLFTLAIPVMSEGKCTMVRMNNHEVFTCHMSATTSCRLANEANPLNVKCRVAEVSHTVPSSFITGRSADDLIAIANVHADMKENYNEYKADKNNGYLSLQGRKIVAQDVAGITSLVCLANGTITQLGLSRNCLQSDGGVALASSLTSPPQLDSRLAFQKLSALFLSSNNLGDGGAIAIAGVMSSGLLPLLIKIGLNDNTIGDIGATAIADAFDTRLFPASAVEVIGLSENMITSAGSCSLANALLHNTSLKRLFLNSNPDIKDVGAVALAIAVERHPALKRLGLSHCGLSSEAGLQLMKSLQQNECLERVCVCGNAFDKQAMEGMKKEGRFNFQAVSH